MDLSRLRSVCKVSRFFDWVTYLCPFISFLSNVFQACFQLSWEIAKEIARRIQILKGIVAAFQVGLIILLITSGLHLKDVKAKAELDEIASANSPEVAKEANKVYMKYAALLTIIILSTLKIPVITAGLFGDHILILFGSFIIDMIVAFLYLVQWVYFTDLYTAGSWLGILCSIACGTMTMILIKFFRMVGYTFL